MSTKAKARADFHKAIQLRQEKGSEAFCCLGMALLDDLRRATEGTRQGQTGVGFPTLYSPTHGLHRSERPVLLTHGGSIVLNYCPSCGHHYDAPLTDAPPGDTPPKGDT